MLHCGGTTVSGLIWEALQGRKKALGDVSHKRWLWRRGHCRWQACAVWIQLGADVVP